MIKIIKPGTLKRCTCEACGCVFSYEGTDVLLIGNGSLDLRYRQRYVKCPQCDNRVILEVKKND